MAIRARSRKRLLIILCGALVVVGGLVGAVMYGKMRTAAEMQEHRTEGLAAYQDGNYEQAIRPLSRYLGRNANDLEALEAFAEALLATRQRDPGRANTAIATLRKIRELDPDNLEARQELMTLFARRGQHTEALELADHLLQNDPEHSEAQRVKGTTLTRLRRFDEAMDTLQRAAEQQPLNLDVQSTIIDIMRQTEQPREQILAHARDLQENHPDDPRAAWLVAFAHFLHGEHADALEWTQKAAEQNPESPETIHRMVRMFDSLQQFARGTILLNQHLERMLAGEQRGFTLQRLWEVGDRNGVQQAIRQLDPGDPTLSAQLVGLVALNLPPDSEAQADWLTELKQREANDEHLAGSWRKVVEAQQKPMAGEDFIAICRTALNEHERHPYFRGWLGDALARQGQDASALEEWQTAMEAAPAWYQPHLRSARTLMAMNAEQQALQHALAAVRRAPNRIETITTFLQTRVAVLDGADDPAYGEVRQRVDQIMERALIPDLVPTWIRLTAMGGDRAELETRLDTLLAEAEELPVNRLLEVQRIVAEVDADLAARVEDHISEKHADAPDVVWRRAVILGRAGEVARGRTLLEQRRDNAGQSDQLAAEIDLLRYDEMTQQQSVADQWFALSEAHPDRRVVHEQVLRSDDAWNQPRRIREVLDRLEAVTGDESVEWRMGMARWLLQQDTTVARESAIDLLTRLTRSVPSLLRPRLMLVEAHRRQGNSSRMLDNLAVAAGLAPDNLDLKFMLATELVRFGDDSRARVVVNQLVDQAADDPDQARRVARLLGEIGQPARAIDILVQHHDGDPAAPDVLLADLYLRNNQPQQARAVVDNLMTHERTSLAAIRFIADFHGRRGGTEAAEQALSRLEELDLPAGVAEVTRAAFYASHVDPQRAVAELEEAVQRAPDRIDLRRGLIAYLVRLNRIDDAMSAAQRAADQVDDPPPWLTLFLDNRPAIRAAADDPRMRPLIEAVIGDAQNANAALEALRIHADRGSDQADPVERTARLRRLAERHPNFMALQVVLIQRYLATDQPNQAAELASQTLQRFRTAVEPAYLAAEAFSAAGRWPEALQAAREWRARASSQPVAADVAIAEAQLRMGQGDEAVAITQRYLDRAMENPEANYRIIFNHARALVASGRHQEAAELLRPLSDQSEQWRRAWLNLAAFAVADTAVAEAWLQEITERADDAPMARAEAAQAWFALHQRTDDEDHRRRAMDLIDPITDRDDAPAVAISLAGTLHHTAGNARRAETLYRRALEKDDLQPTPLNNLAMLILERDGDPAEALQLARQAVEQAPNSAPIHDTIALAHLRLGQTDQALQAVRKAVDIQPDVPDWRITHADILIQDNQLTEARREIDELRRSFMNFVDADSPTAQRIRDLQQKLADATGTEDAG